MFSMVVPLVPHAERRALNYARVDPLGLADGAELPTIAETTR